MAKSGDGQAKVAALVGIGSVCSGPRLRVITPTLMNRDARQAGVNNLVRRVASVGVFDDG